MGLHLAATVSSPDWRKAKQASSMLPIAECGHSNYDHILLWAIVVGIQHG